MAVGVTENIKVIYKDNSAGIVRASSLQQLISSGKIVAFRRSSGWVKIGRDPVRGLGGRYEGPDRRNSIRSNY
jgi:hypothetical protein